eukprot:6174097-Pyramimonas_sp.AAC.1
MHILRMICPGIPSSPSNPRCFLLDASIHPSSLKSSKLLYTAVVSMLRPVRLSSMSWTRVVRHHYSVDVTQRREGQLDQGQSVGLLAAMAEPRLTRRSRRSPAETVDPTVWRGRGHCAESWSLGSLLLNVHRIAATSMEPPQSELLRKATE